LGLKGILPIFGKLGLVIRKGRVTTSLGEIRFVQSSQKSSYVPSEGELLGHPAGLFTLFFAEMWERFSFYGMKAILLFYMLKGFLGYGDKDANAVYGAYTALIYMTPFFGGMVADKVLGARTTVVFGGLLMAAGHLLMTIERDLCFFFGLSLLITGTGFFKPNISSMVGELYPPNSKKRDSGFTLFYIGINLGGAMGPLLCGYIGETYGWHWGFGLATIGMLMGLAVFVAPNRVTQVLIIITAIGSTFALIFYNAGDLNSWISSIFVAIALSTAALAAVVALARGGLPKECGMPADSTNWNRKLTYVILGTLVAIPVFAALVSGFAIVPGFKEQLIVIPESVTQPLTESGNPLVKGLGKVIEETSRPAGLVLLLSGLIAVVYLMKEAYKLPKVPRERLFVVFTLTFFSIWFWAFFEQNGSSVNNFTDRNIDRVSETSLVTESDVGKTVQLSLVIGDSSKSFFSQEYLGHENGSAVIKAQIENALRQNEASKEPDKQMSKADLDQTVAEVLALPKLSMTAISALREYAKKPEAKPEDKFIEWTYTAENVGKIGLGGTEVPASVFQSVNSIFIIIFGLVFTALWGLLGKFGLEPSTPLKFSLGLFQVGLAFAMLYFGAKTADADGMVGMHWILLLYLLMTTGELCVSPVGLSMVTRLTPKQLVSTTMGAWFLASAFAQYLAAIIAQFAVVNEGDSKIVPIPSATVNIYGDVYFVIAVMGATSGLVCLLLTPLLIKWTHANESEG
jgi:proton-dependent oligopeptide transporter, POT family